MAQDKPEVYVSTDLEADGPVPGLHSMLSFASAAFDASQTLLDTFSVNLSTLPHANTHPVTMRWWQTQEQAWAAARAQPLLPPEEAMHRYLSWLRGLPGKPVFVAYPVGFDFPYIRYYLERFTGENPFGFAALDIKSYAMAALRRDAFHATVKRDFPAAWFDPQRPHTHVALDDAIEQGVLFCRMRAALLNGAGQ